jgi:hypothetical protein
MPGGLDGADDPIRTDDLGITSALLYQLSYVGVGRPRALTARCVAYVMVNSRA